MLSFTTSTIINSFVDIYRTGSVVCIAPTGRAAKRMTEQTGREATTIHSYLKMRPGMKKSEVTVTADLLVIDESSMLDIDIFYALMSSLNQNTRLIFIGDSNQLPSIGRGNVLSDMIRSEAIPCVKLEAVYRQKEDSNIHKNASKILSGEKDLLVGPDFEWIPAQSPEDAQKKILLQMKKAAESFGLMESCILTPLRKTKKTSVDVLNPMLQNLLNPKSPNTDSIEVGGKTFRIGDKVMVTRNGALAANGDVGLLVSIDHEKEEVKVDLGYDKAVPLRGEDLQTLDFSYAMTIHKSQGSEYDCVIIVVMDEHKALLQKNLIYTAITRAKKKVVLIGQKSAVEKSIEGVQKPRKTLLKNLLQHLS